MDSENKKKILAFVIPMVGVVLVCAGVSILLTNLYGDALFPSSSSSSSSSSSESSAAEDSWKHSISFNIPMDTVGDTRVVDVTDKVPYYSDAFSTASVRYQKTDNPYCYALSISGNSTNVNKYAADLENDIQYSYKSKDYFLSTIETSYVFDFTDYRLMLTPYYSNYVDYLYVRYIPNGTNFPNDKIHETFIDDACPLIPGMDLSETPTVREVSDSTLTFTYSATADSIALYKQTLGYFGYENNSEVYTNKYNNEVIIDLSAENTLSITALTK